MLKLTIEAASVADLFEQVGDLYDSLHQETSRQMDLPFQNEGKATGAPSGEKELNSSSAGKEDASAKSKAARGTTKAKKATRAKRVTKKSPAKPEGKEEKEDPKVYLKKVLDAKGPVETVALLGEFNCTKLSQLPETGYADFIAACKER